MCNSAHFPGRIFKATGDFPRLVIEQYDPEAVVGIQAVEALFNALDQAVIFAFHGAGKVEYEHPVPAFRDGRKVITRRYRHHEGTPVSGCFLVGDHFYRTGQTLNLAPVDDNILIKPVGN